MADEFNSLQTNTPVDYSKEKEAIAKVIKLLDDLDKIRPKSEKFIALNLFSFIRNVLAHYPVFDSWNEVYITKMFNKSFKPVSLFYNL